MAVGERYPIAAVKVARKKKGFACRVCQMITMVHLLVTSGSISEMKSNLAVITTWDCFLRLTVVF